VRDLNWPGDCRCPPVNVGRETWWGTRAWSDSCPEHGVGTGYFRALPVLPFGYATERDTTREEWLAFLAGGGLSDEE
jgi:hypothetical protein